MSMNWLKGMDHQMDPTMEPGRPTAMPVFAGQNWWLSAAAAGWDARPPPTSWRPAAAPSSSPTPLCWSTRPGCSSPKPFLDHDGADYDSYAELDRAIFFLTQTVVRGMGRAGPRRVHREH
jgi:hypothetical protein